MNINSITRAEMESTGIDECIRYLRDNNIPTTEKYLPVMNSRYTHSLYNDGIPTTYEFYRRYINDVLRTVRKGGVDYVYELYQLRELLRFEPELHIEYNDGIFEVSLPQGEKI